MAAILSWTQLEILASGEKIESGPRHPSLPSLPSSALREGVTASEAIRLPPSSISESLSQVILFYSHPFNTIGRVTNQKKTW